MKGSDTTLRFSTLAFVIFSGVVLLMSSGCASKRFVVEPIDAKIPELKFEYWKDGSWHPAHGHAGAYFSESDKKKFRIKTHKEGGDCQFVYVDGDTHFTRECDEKSEITLNLGKYRQNSPEVIGFSVTMENSGTQQGYFYPLMRNQYEPLPVSFKCPYSKKNGSISVCSRPATYRFLFDVSIKSQGEGDLLFTRKCNGEEKISETLNVSGPETKTLSISSDKANFCVVGLALRQGSTRKSQRIYVRFYDPEYIPLSSPEITKKDDGFKICAPEDYELLSINGKDYSNSFFSDSCKTVESSHVEVLVWDDVGRLSRVVSSLNGRKTSLYLSRINKNSTTNYFTKSRYSWGFYEDLYKWGYPKLRDYCPKEKTECMRDKAKALMDSPTVISAVESWDGSLLKGD